MLLLHLIIKPFDLLNTIPLTKTKALLNNLLISKFKWKSNLEHKLRIFEIVILNTKWKDLKSRKKLVYGKLYGHGKILRTRNCRRKFIKNLLPEKRKENM